MQGSLEPKVRATIIIPAYNAAHTLPAAIESALNQTERSLEVIVADDCSADNTEEVVSAYSRSDPRVHYLRMPKNGGKPLVMNYAAQHARGKWIAILDADDWYAPTRMQELLDAAEEAGVAMVADNLSYYDAHAKREARLAFSWNGPRMVGLDAFLGNSAPLEAFDYGILKPVFLASFLRQHRLEYEVSARNGHDWYMLLDYFVAGGTALIVDKALYYYVQPFGSISRKWATEKRKPYPFWNFYKVNSFFMAKHWAALSPARMRVLFKRGEMFLALAHWQRIKERYRNAGIGAALRAAFLAPPVIWKYLPRKIAIKLRGK